MNRSAIMRWGQHKTFYQYLCFPKGRDSLEALQKVCTWGVMAQSLSVMQVAEGLNKRRSPVKRSFWWKLMWKIKVFTYKVKTRGTERGV
jgi:hypothetical protein